MIKKILLGSIFVVLIGVLVWGGVTRTTAKSADTTAGRRNQDVSETETKMDEVNVGQYGRGRSEIAEPSTNEGGWGYNSQKEEECEENGREGENAQARGADSQDKQQGNGYRGNAADGLTVENDAGNRRGNQGQGQGQGQGGAASVPLTEAEIQALGLALDDEYHALAVYQAVIDKFGQVEPFATIAESEKRHIDALVNQFTKYGLVVPDNTWLGNVPVFDSLAQACAAGAEAEIANAELYDRLFNMTDRQDLMRVFTNLSRASMESHLPEFVACK